ncbi:MAG: hypothetical protein L0211_19195 [Planctomycetaceae bacterium]|nr:hypothetical protein [Planctomycetaceae bacterium]
MWADAKVKVPRHRRGERLGRARERLVGKLDHQKKLDHQVAQIPLRANLSRRCPAGNVVALVSAALASNRHRVTNFRPSRLGQGWPILRAFAVKVEFDDKRVSTMAAKRC